MVQINKAVPISTMEAAVITPQPDWLIPAIGYDSVAGIYRPYKVTIAQMAGASINTIRSGTGAPSDSLGVNGDYYVATDTHIFYGPKTAGAWPAGTSIVGPIGSVILYGTGVPSGGTGVNGDLYVRTSNGDLYAKAAGAWSVITNLTGPAGTDGTDGTNGTNGTNGISWTSGAGAPSGGADGDLYLRTSNGDVYQRAAGVWSVIVNLVGPAGSVGTMPDGTAATPSLAYASETGTGLWRRGAGDMAVSILGTYKFSFTATDFVLPGNPTVALGAATKQYVDLRILTSSVGSVVQAWDADLDTLAALGNWKVNYTNGSGNQVALSLGATDTIFSSTGTAGAPAFQSLDTLGGVRKSGNQALTGGFTSASVSAGTKSSGTYTFDPTAGAVQHATNGGAHTFAPPATHGAWILDYVNNGSAGALTTSGWTKVDGDAFTTTNTHAFRCMISVGNQGSYLSVKRMV